MEMPVITEVEQLFGIHQGWNDFLPLIKRITGRQSGTTRPDCGLNPSPSSMPTRVDNVLTDELNFVEFNEPYFGVRLGLAQGALSKCEAGIPT